MTDAERLALLLEGKLSEVDRTRLLAELDESPELREAFADAAAALNESPAEPARVSEPLPIRIAPRFPTRAVGLAIAAGLVLAVLVPLTRSVRRVADLPTPASVVATLGDKSSGALSIDTKPWRELRGAPGPLTRQARAIRIGALIADLEVAGSRGDTASALIAARIGALADEYPGGGGTGDTYRALAAGGAATAERRSSAAEAMETLVGPRELRLGAWLEAARMAARSHDSAFFAAASTKAALSSAKSFAAGQPGADGATETMTVALDAPARDWNAIAVASDNLLAALAN